MRYLIRTVEAGRRLPELEIDERKQTAIETITAAGHAYVEHEVLVGSTNAAGDVVEEIAYVIEAATPSAFDALPVAEHAKAK